MYLVTNRIATASSGTLSILQPAPNGQVPFDVLVFEITRQRGGWWLDQRARQTLDESVCREIRNQVRDRGVMSTATLYPAFRTALETLNGLFPDSGKEQIFMFSRCNDSPVASFERGLALEAGGARTVVCFSCPVERRHPLRGALRTDLGRRKTDVASAAG
ncbi:MAG: hypothetical protein H6926_01120 [Chromatiales bacterium]|nr:hypothetical protein [Gammaproteobacteria bacterium]MCP5351781.1 hypothetical protein [Chromatiales bacterium]